MKKYLNRGQSLFELVVAIGVSALIIVVLVSLTSNALQNAAFSKNETQAGSFAQEATEWLRGQRDTDINLFTTNILAAENVKRCFNVLNWNSVGPCSAGSAISGTSFVREITFLHTNTVVSGSTKTVYSADITVSWVDSKGSHLVRSYTDFADWRQR